MLRIAVVTAHFPSSGHPTNGRPALETMRILSETCQVKVFYPHASYPTLLKPRKHIYEGRDSSFTVPGVDAAYFNYQALPLISRPFNGYLAARALLPHVRSFAPHVVFSYFVYPDGFAALKIARRLGLPVAVMGVGSDVHSIGDRISAMHTRTVMREADLLIGISDDLRKRMVAMGAPAKKTSALVSGCDLSVFHPMDRAQARQRLGIPPDAEAIVYIGRMDVKKGLRELVEAAASLHAARPLLHVYMIGKGQDKPLIDAAIAGAGAGEYIHAIPGCSFNEVAHWMAAASLVTLPSYMEGCPNVILEALACGRPVVATNVGGIPELMSNECGRLIEPRDAGALKDALAAVLEMRWDADAIAAHWSRGWSTVANELLAMLEPLALSRKVSADAR